MTGATGNIYYGLAEWIDMSFLLHILREEDLFVDIGANVGSYTLLAAGGVGARTLSAEPVPSTFRRLVINITENGLSDKCSADCLGISDREGSLWFTLDQDTTNQIIGDPFTHVGPVQQCPVTTCDAWLAGRTPTLIKIDVEGHDRQVVAGAFHTLAKPSLLALIVETWAEDPDVANSVRAMLATQGFSIANYDPLSRSLTQDTHAQSGGNVLFVRDFPQVAARLQAAPTRELSLGRRI